MDHIINVPRGYLANTAVPNLGNEIQFFIRPIPTIKQVKFMSFNRNIVFWQMRPFYVFLSLTGVNYLTLCYTHFDWSVSRNKFWHRETFPVQCVFKFSAQAPTFSSASKLIAFFRIRNRVSELQNWIWKSSLVIWWYFFYFFFPKKKFYDHLRSISYSDYGWFRALTTNIADLRHPNSKPWWIVLLM